jgi:hypothetical protein
LDAVLIANRSIGAQAIFPASILSNVGNWKQPSPVEAFVCFETVNDQADDFNRVPDRGGTPMFFMITWGLLVNGRWQSWQLVAHDLSLAAEADMKLAWQAELKRLADVHGVDLRDIRLFYWGNREVPLPDLNWFDLLDNIIHREPVAVRGAFGFGLAEVARALHAVGLIETPLPALPGGPLETMAGAWSAAEEAARLGIPLEQVDTIQAIGGFTYAISRTMMEIVALLRRQASAALPEAA